MTSTESALNTDGDPQPAARDGPKTEPPVAQNGQPENAMELDPLHDTAGTSLNTESQGPAAEGLPTEGNGNKELDVNMESEPQIKTEPGPTGPALPGPKASDDQTEPTASTDLKTDGESESPTKTEDTPRPQNGQRQLSGEPESKPAKRARLDNGMVVVPPKQPDLFYSPLKTGLVYDVRMRYHAKIFTSYFEYIDPHPEDPRRIYRIYKRLAESGLIQDTLLLGSDDIGPLMLKIPVREATADEILEVHTQEHLLFIASTEAMSRDRLLEETEKGDSIYVNNDSYLLAKLLCGGSIEACRAVIEGKVKNALAIVRPPGHHSEPDSPGGFCLFSNVAVAAKNMLKLYPESVRRIVIVDWDIHHGNGTQKAFYDDPRVLYISLHRFENGKFYPGTKYGDADKVGADAGTGYSVNVPWQEAGVGDADYVYAFQKIVIPIISEFDPDLVIVSAGFDAADGDIIGQCHVTPAGYGLLTHMLKGLARGKLSVILEGGYNIESISRSALGVAKVLVGEPPEHVVLGQPRLDTLETVAQVTRIQAKYWKCMRPGILASVLDDVSDDAVDDAVSFAEPVRAHQAQALFRKYSFVSLPILDCKDKHAFTDLPHHLDDLILASPDILSCTTAVVLIHDPPEVWASINPVHGTIESTTSVLLEHPLPRFIDKILKELAAEKNTEKVGYIDILVPSSDAKSGNFNPALFAQELLLWVYDNYLSYFSSLKKVVFVGYGDSYHAIVNLYAKRPLQEIKDLVQGTVVFTSRGALKAIAPVMDESMVDWYYQNSVVFTSYMNPCWFRGEDESRRPRKKFGRVLKATVDGLWDVILEKFDESVDFVLDSILEYPDSEA